MKTKKRQKISFFRIILLLVLVAGVVFGGLVLWDKLHESKWDGGVNYGAATDEQKENGAQIKEESIKGEAENEEDGPTEGERRQVEISVVGAEQYLRQVEISVMVKSVAEDGGECKYEFTRGNYIVERTAKGEAEVGYTTCGRLIVPAEQFPVAGEWEVVVSYSSEKSEGKTDKIKIGVDK